MLVDFGAETTTVSIYRDGSLVYLTTLPMGSRNITRDLTSLNCLEERAEEIKKAVGNAMPPTTDGNPLVTDGLDNSAINNIVAARTDEIISNIFEQINYAGLKPEQLPAGIVITGGGTRLRGFDDLLTKQTRMKTRQATLPSQVEITGNGFNPNDTLDVIALLCDAAAMGATECTMMPPQILEKDRLTDINTPANENNAVNDETSRIGILDSDDKIMIDEYDPNDNEENNLSLQQKLDKINKSKKGGKKDTRQDSGKGEKTDSSSSGFWQRIGSRLSDIMKDDNEFE